MREILIIRFNTMSFTVTASGGNLVLDRTCASSSHDVFLAGEILKSRMIRVWDHTDRSRGWGKTKTGSGGGFRRD